MIIDDIIAQKKIQLLAEAHEVPLSKIEKQAMESPPAKDFLFAVQKPGLSVIAEIKKASPSKGLIAADFQPVKTARLYENGGADCISVLTEQHFFQGSNAILEQVRVSTGCPILRKDFMLEERQILEARAIGADCVLLIAAILDDKTLRRLYVLSKELGMSTLMEAHTETEVKRLVQAGADMIGVNHRNLATFAVDIRLFEKLRHFIPETCAAVAESGIHSKADANYLYENGCDAILVGESLMTSKHPDEAVAQYKQIINR